jgi:hypothetical protein
MGMSPYQKIFLGNAVTNRVQLALLVDIILITKLVGLGYGRHFDQAKIEDVPKLATLALTSSIFIVAAIAWSKTSFGLTLLRISDGWIKTLVWVIIISMNILFAISPLLHFVACAPIRKSWNPLVPGTCWDPKVYVYYDIFVSGTFPSWNLPRYVSDSSCSILSCYGFHSCLLANPPDQGPTDAQTGEDWRRYSYEHGYIVS